MKRFVDYFLPTISESLIKVLTDAANEGASVSRLASLIDAFIHKQVSEETCVFEMEESIYLIDFMDVLKRYKPSDYMNARKNSSSRFRDVVYGTIYGDIAGSRLEFLLNEQERASAVKGNYISFNSSYTDDSLLTCATAGVIADHAMDIKNLSGVWDIFREYRYEDNPFTEKYREYTLRYPDAGWGRHYYHWAVEQTEHPYRSFGNGAAMRVSPIGAYFGNVEDVIYAAALSACCTHNHPEGIKGAVVAAMCVWLALNSYSKERIYHYMKHIYRNSEYFLDLTMQELMENIPLEKHDTSCMFAVPAAVICFHAAESYEGTIRNALSFFGDSNTIAAIAGELWLLTMVSQAIKSNM